MSQGLSTSVDSTQSPADDLNEEVRNFDGYFDIHYTGGVDSTPEQIRANTCGVCYTVFPATGICGVCPD